MSLAEGKAVLKVIGKLWEERKELIVEITDCWNCRSLYWSRVGRLPTPTDEGRLLTSESRVGYWRW